MTSRSEVHHANHYSIEASYKKEQILYVELYNVLLFCEVKIEMHVTYNEWILVPEILISQVQNGKMFDEKNLVKSKITYLIYLDGAN